MLSLTGVSKTYHDHRRSITAVEGIDLEVRPGEALGLIGPSGSGKSTLLQILAGLIEPTGGRVERNGEVGLAFQQPLLYPWLAVRENIGLARRFVAYRHAEPARVDALLDEFGLTELADARTTSLSGGQAQRVALARCSVRRPGPFRLRRTDGNHRLDRCPRHHARSGGPTYHPTKTRPCKNPSATRANLRSFLRTIRVANGPTAVVERTHRTLSTLRTGRLS